MTILFASDLDRTLIYSKNSRGHEVDECDLTVVEWKEDKPTAFMTTNAVDTFQKLPLKVNFVPVTTRTASQYKRITKLAHSSNQPTYAIVSNGAVILENGQPIEEWTNRIHTKMNEQCTSIDHVLPQLNSIKSKPYLRDILQAESWFVYMIIHESLFSVEDFEELSQLFYEQGYTLSHQGRKLYIMPNCINKNTALQFVKERLNPSVVIAAGDSTLDLDMVVNADRGFIPSHGEAAKDGKLLPPHVQMTKQKGVLAGEEILNYVKNFRLE